LVCKKTPEVLQKYDIAGLRFNMAEFKAELNFIATSQVNIFGNLGECLVL
jgi:hypothetical protein